jgi:hypothetical protein
MKIRFEDQTGASITGEDIKRELWSRNLTYLIEPGHDPDDFIWSILEKPSDYIIDRRRCRVMIVPRWQPQVKPGSVRVGMVPNEIIGEECDRGEEVATLWKLIAEVKRKKIDHSIPEGSRWLGLRGSEAKSRGVLPRPLGTIAASINRDERQNSK